MPEAGAVCNKGENPSPSLPFSLALVWLEGIARGIIVSEGVLPGKVELVSKAYVEGWDACWEGVLDYLKLALARTALPDQGFLWKSLDREWWKRDWARSFPLKVRSGPGSHSAPPHPTLGLRSLSYGLG